MSRLSNILNGIINPFGKQLWSGTWSNGAITVPNTDKYFAFIVSQNGSPLLAVKAGNIIRGFGITGQNDNNTAYTRAFGASLSGNTWTLQYNNYLVHTESGNHNAGATSKITEIIGLVPNWGVLHSSIFNAFSHLQRLEVEA